MRSLVSICIFPRVCSTLIAVIVLLPIVAFAGVLDSVEPPSGAKIIRTGDVTIAAKGATGSDIILPKAGTFILDYAVEGGKELLITLLTSEQYHQVSIGQKWNGPAPLRATVSGTGSKSVELAQGNYFLAFSNLSGTGTKVSYRSSFR